MEFAVTTTPPPSTVNLLPCPACWAKSTLEGRGIYDEDWVTVYSVKCTKCWCKTASKFNTPQEAANEWNTRTNQPSDESRAREQKKVLMS